MKLVRCLCYAMPVPRHKSDASSFWCFQTRFDEDCDEGYSAESFVHIGPALFAVDGVLPWGA